MRIEQRGRSVIVNGAAVEFAAVESAERRAAFVGEAVTWAGTPFVNCGDVKGQAGAVDCAMLLVRASVDTGLLPAFDPRPYSPDWCKHRTEEKFLGWIAEKLGAREIPLDAARVGDVLVYHAGRCFAHGAIVLSDAEIFHAWSSWGMAINTLRSEPLLNWIGGVGREVRRPVKAFELWGA